MTCPLGPTTSSGASDDGRGFEGLVETGDPVEPAEALVLDEGPDGRPAGLDASL
jgi:hypothetical protein